MEWWNDGIVENIVTIYRLQVTSCWLIPYYLRLTTYDKECWNDGKKWEELLLWYFQFFTFFSDLIDQRNPCIIFIHFCWKRDRFKSWINLAGDPKKDHSFFYPILPKILWYDSYIDIAIRAHIPLCIRSVKDDTINSYSFPFEWQGDFKDFITGETSRKKFLA